MTLFYDINANISTNKISSSNAYDMLSEFSMYFNGFCYKHDDDICHEQLLEALILAFCIELRPF